MDGSARRRLRVWVMRCAPLLLWRSGILRYCFSINCSTSKTIYLQIRSSFSKKKESREGEIPVRRQLLLLFPNSHISKRGFYCSAVEL